MTTPAPCLLVVGWVEAGWKGGPRGREPEPTTVTPGSEGANPDLEALGSSGRLLFLDLTTPATNAAGAAHRRLLVEPLGLIALTRRNHPQNSLNAKKKQKRRKNGPDANGIFYHQSRIRQASKDWSCHLRISQLRHLRNYKILRRTTGSRSDRYPRRCYLICHLKLWPLSYTQASAQNRATKRPRSSLRLTAADDACVSSGPTIPPLLRTTHLTELLNHVDHRLQPANHSWTLLTHQSSK